MNTDDYFDQDGIPEHEDGPWAIGFEERSGSLNAHKLRIQYLQQELDKCVPKRWNTEIQRLVNRMCHKHINHACKMGVRKEAQEQRYKDADTILEILKRYE